MVRKTVKYKHKRNLKTRKYNKRLKSRKYKKHNKRLKSRKSRKGGMLRTQRTKVKTTEQKNQEESDARQKKYDDSIKTAAEKRRVAVEKKRKENTEKEKLDSKKHDSYRQIFIDRARRMAHLRKITPEEKARNKAKTEEFIRLFKSKYVPQNEKGIHDVVKTYVDLYPHALPIGTTTEQLKNNIKYALRSNPVWENLVDKEYFDDYLEFLVEQYKQNRGFPDSVSAEQALQKFELEDFLNQYSSDEEDVEREQ